MTNAEQDQIIGQVVREHEAAKRRLQFLVTKGQQMGEQLLGIGTALKAGADVTIDGDVFRVHQYGILPAMDCAMPSVEDVRELVRTTNETKAQVEQLERQRKALNV
jgi:hypothetical protein